MTAFSQPERQGLERLQRTAAVEAHPDADYLTAFAERALTERERDSVLQHLAACAECREVVALATPEAVPAGAAQTARRPALARWPVLRWGAMAASLVVVVMAVLVGRKEQHQAQIPLPSFSDKMPISAADRVIPVPEVAPPDEAPVSPKPGLAKKKAELGTPTRSTTVKNGSIGGPVVAAKVAPVQPLASAPAGAYTYELRDREAQGSAKAKSTAPPSTVAKNGVPMSVNGATAQNRLEPEQLDSATSSRQLAALGGLKKEAPAAAPPPPSVNETVAVRAESAPVQTRTVTTQNLTMLPLRRSFITETGAWRISDAGQLQNSRDRGKSWQTVLPQVTFRVVNVVGSDIWAGGANSALYCSHDGGTWTTIKPHTGNKALTGDIIGMQFADTRRGTVKTSTGETWTTADGGQSWHVR